MIELLPCPFCGSDRIACNRKWGHSGYQCRCLECGILQGLTFRTDSEEAKKHWNKRARPPRKQIMEWLLELEKEERESND